MNEHSTNLSVIAPCFQEQENIDTLVDRMLRVFDTLTVGAELVLVDDGSTDDTWRRITHRCTKDARVRGVRHARNRGIEGAWRSGLGAARGTLVCLIDADLQNRPEDIPRLLARYRQGDAAMVQAVRHSGGSGERWLLFTRGLNVLLNSAFGTKLRDNKSGFVLCRREVLVELLRHRYWYRYFQSFIGASAAAQGYSVAEVDTEFDARHAGSSFLPRLPVRATVRILWELIKFRWETRAQQHAACRGSVLVSRERPLIESPLRTARRSTWTSTLERDREEEAGRSARLCDRLFQPTDGT